MGDSKRIKMLDYIKAFAIMFVIINHSMPSSMGTEFFMVYIIKMAVPFFMAVSGFTFAMSYEKIGDKGWYNKKTLLSKFVSFAVPIIIICILYVLKKVIEQESGMGVRYVIERLLWSNYGKGGYYYYLLLQLILIFPLIFKTVKRKYGIGIIFGINLLYEIIMLLFPVEKLVYRIIVLRYLTMVGLGSWLYLNKQKKIHPMLLAVSFGLGVGYLHIYTIFAKQFHTGWANTNVFSAFYIFPICYLLIKQNLSFNGIPDTILTSIGKSTYHIMCVQMAWFWLPRYIYPALTSSLVLQTIINLTASLILGYLFYLADSKYISGRIISKIKAAGKVGS